MTKIIKLITVLIAATLPAAHADTAPPKTQEQEVTLPKAGSFGREAADWKKEPFEFLALLIRQHEQGVVSVIVGDAPKSWIKKEHIGLLILLLDSKEPCASVYPGRSSEIFPGRNGVKTSTVGQEAAYLIESYRHIGTFPKSGTDVSCHLQFDINEIKSWWADEQKKLICQCKTIAMKCTSSGCKATTEEEHEPYNHKPRWIISHENSCPLATPLKGE
jgi:hypothetical protein